MKRRSVQSATPSAKQLTRRWRWLCALVVVAAVVAGVVLLRWRWKGQRRRYVAVIDAGSTGTRIFDVTDPNQHLTSIPPEAAAAAVPVRTGIRAYHRVETLPGLQSMTVDALGQLHNASRLYSVVEEALGPLLAWAKAVVPSEEQSATSVHLLATAGVRALSEEHQKALLEALKEILQHSEFSFDAARGVEIMSGNQEGIFGWLALNHDLGRLNVPQTPVLPYSRKWIRGSFGKESNKPYSPGSAEHELAGRPVGALDLGGSSMEATFPSSSTKATQIWISGVGSRQLYQVSPGASGRRYGLESRTFESLGLNSAFQTSLRMAAAEQATVPRLVKYPCTFAGYNETIKISAAASAVPESEQLEIQLVGEPSWEACGKLIQKVLSSTLHCQTTPCFGGAEDVRTLRFVGLNGFYVVWHFFNLSETATLQDLESAGRRFCQRTWSAVRADLGDVIHFDKYCFRSLYVSQLLQEVVGQMVAAPFTVASESVSWPTGAALFDIQAPPTPPPSLQLPSYPSVGMACVGVSLLLCLCIRVVRRTSQDGGLSDLTPGLERSLHSISPFHRVRGIKRRNFSYRRLHDLSSL